MWRFLINLETAKTLSRLHLSSKSLPGVLEVVEVSDDPGGGVICQDFTCPPSLSLESWRLWRFLMILEVVSFVKISPVLQVSSWSLGGHGVS